MSKNIKIKPQHLRKEREGGRWAWARRPFQGTRPSFICISIINWDITIQKLQSMTELHIGQSYAMFKIDILSFKC